MERNVLSLNIIETLRRLGRKKRDSDRTPRFFSTGHMLMPAEIYLIEILGDHPHESVTAIADIMQITKGAVSQTLKKLESKGLVEKDSDPVNASRALVSLSNQGRMILFKHKEWHRRLDCGLVEYLDTLNRREASTIHDFLEKYELSLDRKL